MQLKVRVFAPSIETEVFTDLSGSLLTATGSAVALSGYYGAEEKRASVFEDIHALIAGLDLNKYWAVVSIYISTPVGSAVLAAVAGKTLDAALRWGTRQKRAPKQVKIRLYGADGKLISDEEA